jgi:hypothetical protein
VLIIVLNNARIMFARLGRIISGWYNGTWPEKPIKAPTPEELEPAVKQMKISLD